MLARLARHLHQRHVLGILDHAVPVVICELEKVHHVLGGELRDLEPAEGAVQLRGRETRVVVGVECHKRLPRRQPLCLDGMPHKRGLRTLLERHPLVNDGEEGGERCLLPPALDAPPGRNGGEEEELAIVRVGALEHAHELREGWWEIVHVAVEVAEAPVADGNLMLGGPRVGLAPAAGGIEHAARLLPAHRKVQRQLRLPSRQHRPCHAHVQHPPERLRLCQ
mmetsp:Transcript_24235/g.49051  ORF Transcript_24235/g.49051 Transcript_24235/m.49051 type:complete len:223 (-) Transcript_24235:602-1270(-)